MTTTLQSSWSRCWPAIGASGDGRAVMHRLIAAYEEPHRKYHTVRHLTECLTLLDQHYALAREPAEVEVALWFHDAIYKLKAGDNEARSAQWAEAELRGAGVSLQRIERVGQHILATRHAAAPQGQDQMLMIDIDLAILGAPRARFEEYEAQVAAEYAWVPSFLYRRKRREILASLLARVPLYGTPALRAALETQARDNLSYSLRQLGGT